MSAAITRSIVTPEDVTGTYPSGDLVESLLDEAYALAGLLADHCDNLNDAGHSAVQMLERKLGVLVRLYPEQRDARTSVDTPIPLVPKAKAPKKAARSRRKAA